MGAVASRRALKGQLGPANFSDKSGKAMKSVKLGRVSPRFVSLPSAFKNCRCFAVGILVLSVMAPSSSAVQPGHEGYVDPRWLRIFDRHLEDDANELRDWRAQPPHFPMEIDNYIVGSRKIDIVLVGAAFWAFEGAVVVEALRMMSYMPGAIVLIPARILAAFVMSPQGPAALFCRVWYIHDGRRPSEDGCKKDCRKHGFDANFPSHGVVKRASRGGKCAYDCFLRRHHDQASDLCGMRNLRSSVLAMLCFGSTAHGLPEVLSESAVLRST